MGKSEPLCIRSFTVIYHHPATVYVSFFRYYELNTSGAKIFDSLVRGRQTFAETDRKVNILGFAAQEDVVKSKI
jgi:hypothetical protein